jgi:hypothetical protein
MDRTCNSHGGSRNVYSILVGKPHWREHFGDLGIHGRVILEKLFVKM